MKLINYHALKHGYVTIDLTLPVHGEVNGKFVYRNNPLLQILFRFLLARHKAAVDVYNEAAKMSEKDWV